MARINRVDSAHDIGKICSIELVSKTYSVDSIGNRVPTDTLKSLFASIRSVYRTEFANAGQNGIKAAYIFTIWDYEYNGQDELVYNSEYYSIYRNYIRKDGRIELYTEKKVGACE